MSKHIGEAMKKKPISVAPEIQLFDAIEIMRSWGMRHLPVTGADGRVVGLLSERDIYRHMALHPNSKASVHEAMIANPYLVEPTDLLADVAETMAREKYGCAIVVGSNGICGIFTTTDALRILALMLREPLSSPFKVMRLEEYFRSEAVA